METIDLEYERLLEQRDKYKESVKMKIVHDVNLDVDLLEEVLDKYLPSVNKRNSEPYSAGQKSFILVMLD